MEPQYAVYVVIIEDGSDADQELAEHVDSLQRLAADKTYEEALDILRGVDDQFPFTGF